MGINLSENEILRVWRLMGLNDGSNVLVMCHTTQLEHGKGQFDSGSGVLFL